ncbi:MULTISPECIES: acyltransferase family protein [Gemella]|uniref:acyltransferase family protein n=1 Tax=Gemella TaxID=1378 RepID=UPI000767EDBE|nr:MULTISPECIES: acyltransferase family protein [Gemella]AME08897.1 acetyltransferase [Gemella sp. oral taxon 928]AXI26469.1 acetyltransferase [Gemella sp. ND 6198]
MQKTRIKYIDMLKALAIILVILGHMSYTPSKVKLLLYIFHMPLFFFLSGLVFSVEKYNTFWSFFKRKAKTIVILFFLLNISVFAVKSILLQPNLILKIDIVYFIKSLVLADRMHIYYQLWFLNALFVSEIISYLIVKYCKVWYQWLMVVVGLFLSIYVGKIAYANEYWLIWSIDLAPYAVLFILLGYYVKNNMRIFNNVLKKRYFLIAVLISIALGVVNKRVDLYYQETNNIILYFVAAVFGIWACLIFFKNIPEINFIEKIGQNTLIYYAYHSPIVLYILDIIFEQLAGRYTGIFINNYVIMMFEIICAVGICELIALIINRTFPVLVGRR